MTSLRAWPPAGIATVAIIGLGTVAALIADLPGHLSYDSVIQLLEGRSGVYGTWHPPVMSWLLGLCDDLVRGTGLFVFLQIALGLGAFLSLIRLGAPTWPAAAVAALCMLSPQFLIYQGIVWKDVLFANAAVAGFVCLAQAASLWSSFRIRLALIVAAFALLSMAALARQNGAVVIVAASLALGWIAFRNARARGWRDGLIYSGAALIGAGVVIVGATMLLDLRSDADPDEWGPIVQTKLLQNYDIVAMVAAHPGLELPQLEDTEPALAKNIRTEGVRLYTPQRNDTLASSAPLQAALADSEPGELRDQWVYLVKHHPGLYLTVRLHAFDWVAFTPDVRRCVPFAVGIGGPLDEMRQLGISPRLDVRDKFLTAYGDAFVGTPVFSHITFALIAIGALVLLLRRRSPTDIAMASMLAGAFLFVLSFFVISIACDYRYLYFLDMSSMFAAFYVALNPEILAFRRRTR
jgi:hypothetical protein